MQSIMLARADWYPMSLAYLAGAATEAGHDVLIFNGEHDPDLDYVNLTTYSANYYLYTDALADPQHYMWQRIRSVIEQFKPDVVGITSFSVKYPSAQRVAAIVKDYDPTVPVIMGGQHTTIMTDEVLSNPHVDFAARGEGEQTFVEFLHALENGREWETVDGLSHKSNGKVVHNRPRALMQDIDEIPYPSRESLYDLKNYSPTSLAKLFASRGCPFSCTYCGTQNIWTKKFRNHSPQRIVDEIKLVKKEYGATYFTFFDDVFGISKKNTMALTDAMIDAHLNIKWDCLTRANLVSDELLINMKNAGCTKIDMGVESGSAKILKDTKKGVTKDEIRKGARLIRKHGIMLYTFFMVGLPTETEEDVLETRRFLKEMKPDWAGISIFTPIPGTEIYKDLQAQGRIDAKPDFSKFSHQSPNSNFAFGMMSRDGFPKLAQETLEFIQSYNGSLRNLLRRGMTRGYHRNPKLFVSDFRKLLAWKGILTKSHQGSHAKFYSSGGVKKDVRPQA